MHSIEHEDFDMMWTGSTFRAFTLAVVLLPTSGVTGLEAMAMVQAPAATSAAARQLGTVKAISGNSLTLASDGGAQVSVTVADGARILQLAPGSTDLKSAQVIALGDITTGDRVLVTGKSGDDGSFTAARVILMKSTDIAQKNETEKADWQRRGSGGLVSAVNGSTLTISSGVRKISIETTGTTKFRRYAGDSVKFEDAKLGTLAQVQVGDQLRVRGNKSEDGATIQAEEVVSGSFKNLAGTIATVNAAGGTLTLKDLATKKTVTVNVTSNSDLRKLPAEMAARFAAREHGGTAAAGANRPTGAAGSEGGAPAGAGTAGSGFARGAGGPGGPGRSGGGDLSQMLSRLPTETIGDLKVGDAVMVVASQADAGSSTLTAVTMLSGVEPILAAAPSGAPAMTLSPWNMGGGAADAGSPQ
jgi:co-chaperonin GroES (HSP10)